MFLYFFMIFYLSNQVKKRCKKMDELQQKIGQLCEPTDLFNGKRLPKGFALPDNILIFHHDFPVANPNSHQRYTLVIPNGQMSYLLDDSPVELKKDDVLIITPGQMRYLMPNSSCYSRLFITFETPEPPSYIPDNNLGQFTLESSGHLRQMLDFYLDGKTVQCSLELVRFLYSLGNITLPPQKKSFSPLAAKALSYIHRHLEMIPDHTKIARHLNISASHLRMVFRREIGMSIGSYIAKQHLDIAKYHLHNTGMSISEIAEKCGYGSIYAFSAFFKKQTGVSPLQFRKS